MRTILLIRHGETVSNVGLPTSFPETIPLTKLGIKQAECIAEYLKSHFSETPSLDLIITSPYQRTKQTAAPTKLLFPSVPEEEWPVVKEFTYLSSVHGEHSTIDDRRPLVEAYWKACNLSYIDGPGSESFEQFIESARRVIRHLKCAEYDTIAMFSHKQFICALLWLLQRDPVDLCQEAMRDFKNFLDKSLSRNYPEPALIQGPNQGFRISSKNALVDGAIVQVQFGDSYEPWRYEIITSHLKELEKPETVGV